MSDNTDAGYGIIARTRVWAISDGRLPTDEDYHTALVQCLRDTAAEIDRLRLTDAERRAIADAADRYAELTPESAETAATLRGLLERLT